jgi:hypothetical protein
LAGGYCPASWQVLFNDFVSLLSGTVPGEYSTFVIGSSTPAAGDRDKLWIKTDAGTGLLVTPWAFFRFMNGQWLGTHPVPVSDGRIQIFTGTLAQIDALDGGNSNAVADWDGPFWERDTDMNARFPVGVGTFDGSTVVSEDTNGGTDEITLAMANMPPHWHGTGNYTAGNDDISLLWRAWVRGATDPATFTQHFCAGDSGAPQNVSVTTGGAGSTNAVQDEDDLATAFTAIPPFRGVYFIRRTARIYFVG